MKIEIQQVGVYANSVVPAIYFDLVTRSEPHMIYPLYITGELVCANKMVSFLNVSSIETNSGMLKSIPQSSRQANSDRRITNWKKIRMVAELNERKIDFLENERLKQKDNSLPLLLRLNIEAIKMPVAGGQQNFHSSIFILKPSERYTIPQNIWLEKFSPSLGIGEFYLVELIKPQPKNENNIWAELYEILIKNINEMEETIKNGDWQRTMEISRKFFENIKIGDSKTGHKKYKDSLTNRLTELQFDDKGIKNLLDGIHQFFQFASKFIHEKGTNGEHKPIPNAKKEDAYFIYSLCINLTNLIYEKVKDKT